MKSDQVVISGVGIVSALGVGHEEWLAAAGEGEPAFEVLTAEEGAGSPCVAAPVIGYEVAPLLETRKTYLDRHTALLLGAMSLALDDAGLKGSPLSARAGLMVGSAWGGLGTMETFFRDVLTKGAKFAKPILFPHAYANTAIAMAAIEWMVQGPHEHFAGGRLASANALLAALDTLGSGEADIVFACGCEALSPALIKLLREQGELPEDAEARAGIPYDPASGGIVPGEGAAVLVLETAASVEKRRARFRATLAGAGLSSGEGAAIACRQAMSEAGKGVDSITAILTPGSGNPLRDAAYASELKTLLRDKAPLLTASAGLQGDCLGAGTAMDLAAATILKGAGFVPPATSEPACENAFLPIMAGESLPAPADASFMVSASDGGESVAFVIM